ncbi:MAG: restriction endonuclease subunit S [Roseibacillus sp.]|nr:restriction endonuclease subunit S [Roseibacillus sp.]
MNWSTVPLQDLSDDFKKDIVDGPFGSNLKREDYQAKGNPVLKIQNIKEFRIEWKKIDCVSTSKFQQLKRHSYHQGDIVMTKLGDPLGVSAIVDRAGDGLIVADLVRIRAQKINSRFLCYCLNAPQTRTFINTQSKGATRPRVRITTVRELPIPVPPLAEQERIVGILDEAFEGIATATAHAERNLINAQELFQSVLQSTFEQRGEDWVETAIGKICDVKDGTHDSPKYVESGIPFVTQKNVTWDGLSFEKTRQISQKDHDSFYKRSNVSFGDVLISMIGANRGMACLVDDKRTFSIKNVGLFKACPELDSGFLLLYLKSPIAAKHVLSLSKGAAQGFIGLGALRVFPISLPPINQQKPIVKKLDAVAAETRRLEAIYQRKFDALAELKQSLLQRAFAGEL